MAAWTSGADSGSLEGLWRRPSLSAIPAPRPETDVPIQLETSHQSPPEVRAKLTAVGYLVEVTRDWPGFSIRAEPRPGREGSSHAARLELQQVRALLGG
jgi:hypothetical protein